MAILSEVDKVQVFKEASLRALRACESFNLEDPSKLPASLAKRIRKHHYLKVESRTKRLLSVLKNLVEEFTGEPITYSRLIIGLIEALSMINEEDAGNGE